MKGTLLASLAALLVATAAPAWAADLPVGGTFADDDLNVHEGDIEAMAAAGITKGCDDVRPEFCPDDPVTRGQMAAFLVRAFPIPSSDEDAFGDDDGNLFEAEINALAAAGVTKGCNPPANTDYCPDDPVRRGEMASFLVRVMDLAELYPEPTPKFVDTSDSVHAVDIDRLAASGVAKGCNPPDNDEFCPRQEVTRAQMASFLTRALGLEPMVPPPRPPVEEVYSFTTYHNCCESRVTNIHVIADAIDGAVVYPGETFSINELVGARTESKGYVAAPILLNGESYCCDSPLNIGGGISQFATTLYNAVFRGGYEIVEHQPHSRYIDRYPLGIEATLGYPTPDVVFTNDTLTTVTIDTSYTGSSITVTIYGNNLDRDVDWDVDPDGGITWESGGYVVVTRTITEADGTDRTETWTWSYQAETSGLIRVR